MEKIFINFKADVMYLISHKIIYYKYYKLHIFFYIFSFPNSKWYKFKNQVTIIK